MKNIPGDQFWLLLSTCCIAFFAGTIYEKYGHTRRFMLFFIISSMVIVYITIKYLHLN
jgi:hypothetical protein